MTSKRASRDESVRLAILDAAEEILRNEGHAAVTSRRVASEAGLKSQLVHYYFHTMDALFIAVLRRIEDRHFERLVQAVGSSNPLRALWTMSIESDAPRLNSQFMLLAVQHEEMREEIIRSAERTRSIYVALLTRVVEERGLKETLPPPIVLAFFMAGASRALVNEAALGFTMGHEEMRAFAEQTFEHFEAGAPKATASLGAAVASAARGRTASAKRRKE